MSTMEVVLIVLGLIVFAVSFLLPAGRKRDAEDLNQISEEQIREMIDREVEEAKIQIGEIVEETINYSMEKTERSMDRLTNEKMLAVNEYSDTVLEQINKNHKEVVFLYDMLNDKQENLKLTVSEAVKTATEVKQTVKDAEITAREAEEKVKEVRMKVETSGELKQQQVETTVKAPAEPVEFIPIHPEKIELNFPLAEAVEKKPKKPGRKPKAQKEADRQKTGEEQGKPVDIPKMDIPKMDIPKMDIPKMDIPKVDISLNTTDKAVGRNSNERILELHKAGKSNMAIAKELGLGIGEVKLVIDLFEGI